MIKMTPKLWIAAALATVAVAGVVKVVHDNNVEEAREATIEKNKQILWCAAGMVQSKFDITKSSKKYDYLMQVLATSAEDDAAHGDAAPSYKHSLKAQSKQAQFDLDFNEETGFGFFRAANDLGTESNMPHALAMDVQPKRVVIDYTFDPSFPQITSGDYTDGIDSMKGAEKKKALQAFAASGREADKFIKWLHQQPNRGRSHVTLLLDLTSGMAIAKNISVQAVDGTNNLLASDIVPSLTQGWDDCMKKPRMLGFDFH